MPVPFILVPVTIQARFKKELHILWQGLTYFDQQEDQQDLLEQGANSNDDAANDKLVFLVRRPDLDQKKKDPAEDEEGTALPGVQLEDEENTHEE